MDSGEKESYERSKYQRIKATTARMMELPEVRRAIEKRTALELTCPHGHRLFPAVLDTDPYRDQLLVRPLDDYGRARPVAVDGSPFAAATKSSVCLEPGCPTRVQGEGRCDEHGGRPAIAVDPLATRFSCRVQSCGWSDRVNTDRLLRVIALVLVAGGTEVPVTGFAARRGGGR
jgi:hypothetical protein